MGNKYNKNILNYLKLSIIAFIIFTIYVILPNFPMFTAPFFVKELGIIGAVASMVAIIVNGYFLYKTKRG